ADKLPVGEDFPLNSKDPYGISKILAEQICDLYANNFNASVTILRQTNIYGPGQPEKWLIPKIIKNPTKGNLILGDVDVKNDYLYIDDLIDLYTLAMKGEETGIFNAGTGKSSSARDIINLVSKIKNKEIKFEINKELIRKRENDEMKVDYSKAKKFFGWSPKTTLERGLKKMIEM
ncbi:MAG: NAD(P)-dependent oxidoreductase, partial [Candidatus Micrarchaeota archaeon]